MEGRPSKLAGLVPEHLGGGGVDDGDAAFEVDAVDAVADGFEDGVGLAGEGADAAFGADLLADVDAEAEDVGVAAGDVDELVAEGDEADFAVAMAEVEHALAFAGGADLVEIAAEAAAVFDRHELAERVADDLVDGAADAFGTVGVDGEELAVEVVGADHAEGAFDELAVAGLTLAEGGLGRALDGDVDAGCDDEGDLALGVRQGGGRPGDPADGTVAIEPAVFKGGGEIAGAEAVEGLDGFSEVFLGDEFVPGIAADEDVEVVSAGELAGAIEANDAAGGIVDRDEGGDGIEDGGDEVAFDGEGALNALPGAGGAVDLADAAVELKANDDLAAKGGERFGLGYGEAARMGVEHEQGADGDAAGSGERGSGVEAEATAIDEDAGGGEVWILPGVSEFVDGVAEDGGFARSGAERELGGMDADAGLEPEAIGADEGDGGDGSVADVCGQAGEIVEDGIGRRELRTSYWLRASIRRASSLTRREFIQLS